MTQQHEIPNLSNPDECQEDLQYRREIRLKYPGACSLEYQNVIETFLTCLLRWNPDTQKCDGPGILGNVVAFAPAHEEQFRYTLHSHWQIWVTELSSTKREGLWDSDPVVQKNNREDFYKYVDSVMKASYTTPLCFKHKCNFPSSNQKLDITETELQHLRDARNENLCHEIGGQILQCSKCNTTFSPKQIVENTFSQRLQAYGISPDIDTPPDNQRKLAHLSNAQLDMAALSHVYDFYNNEQNIPTHLADTHWGEEDIRSLLLQHRFEYHCCFHRFSCFKKGCECRFFFPFAYCPETTIDEDDDNDIANEVPWYRLSEPHIKWMSPWMLTPQRELGCEYVNTFNCALSEIFNCNTNVQIGDVWQVYYSTLYGSKSTQKEDSDQVQRILQSTVRRLAKIEENIITGKDNSENPDKAFKTALGVMLSGLRAATTRHVVSATMAHLLISLNGQRFQFSHEFGHLLVSQLNADLENEETFCRIKTIKVKGETHFYKDSSSDDYIFRPHSLENTCAYLMSMWYRKTRKSNKAINAHINQQQASRYMDTDDTSYDSSCDSSSCTETSYESDSCCNSTCDNSSSSSHVDPTSSNTDSETVYSIGLDKPPSIPSKELTFTEGHPAQMYTKLTQLKRWVVPLMFYEDESLCSIEHLQLGNSKTNVITDQIREYYAKTALLMFYPFRVTEDIMIEGSYWKLFHSELIKFNKGEETVFWSKGFEILQNIENRRHLQHGVKKRDDKVIRETTCLIGNQHKDFTSPSNDQKNPEDLTP